MDDAFRIAYAKNLLYLIQSPQQDLKISQPYIFCHHGCVPAYTFVCDEIIVEA